MNLKIYELCVEWKNILVWKPYKCFEMQNLPKTYAAYLNQVALLPIIIIIVCKILPNSCIA